MRMREREREREREKEGERQRRREGRKEGRRINGILSQKWCASSSTYDFMTMTK
jgi:hypothetical protein